MRALGRLRPMSKSTASSRRREHARRNSYSRTTSSGHERKTIEILNTDGGARDARRRPHVRAASCRTRRRYGDTDRRGRTALGNYTAALVSDHDGLSATFGRRRTDRGTLPPLYDDDDKLREKIASQNADFTNSGGPGGGVITPNALREFVGADIRGASG
jgi:hypothetical protein